MLKKYLSLLIIAVMALPIFIGISLTSVNAEDNIPEALYNIDSRGGTILRIPDFDLSKPDVKFWTSNCDLTYKPLSNGKGYYRYKFHKTTATGEASSGYATEKYAVKLKPNTKYIVSVLMRTNFDRKIVELNVTMPQTDGANIIQLLYSGAPANTNGWTRYEYTATTDSRGGWGGLMMSAYKMPADHAEDALDVADAAIIELPTEPLKPYAPGEGMVFGGSSGHFNMKVESAVETDSNITVTTTGARYTFDKINSTIVAEQRLNKVRKVSSWKSNKSFAGLKILSKSDNEALLTNNEVTFGVQMDSMLFTTTHNSDLELILTSEMGGLWNRFAFGNLFCRDDIGGFTVNPDIPLGTGRAPRAEVITPNLDFVDKVSNTDFISTANAGWQFKWTISPGERLVISTFPARPYDWEQSFKSTPMSYRNEGNTAQYKIDREKYGIDVALLWNFHWRGFGMSFGKDFIPNDENVYKANIKAAKDAGIRPITYMSLAFWYSRNLDEFYEAVKRERDLYGIEGIYSDGLGSPNDWVNTYQCIRRLRELFPDGVLYFHNSSKPGAGGGPPLALPEHNIPNMETYADITLKGENIKGNDINWPYHRYLTSTFNSSNTISIEKGDNWKAGGINVEQSDQDYLVLEHNSRARLNTRNFSWTNYQSILAQLKKEWEINGDKPDFFTTYYQPLARNLTRPFIKPYEVKPLLDENFESKTQKQLTNEWFAYQTDNTSVAIDGTGDQCVKISDNNNSSNAYIARKILPLSGPFSFEYKIKAEGASTQQGMLDTDSNVAIGLTIENGSIKYLKGGGEAVDLQPAVNGTWYNIKIEGDTDTDIYDIYIDSVKVLSGASFNKRVNGIYSIIFRTDAQSTGNAFIDNIKIINKI